MSHDPRHFIETTEKEGSCTAPISLRPDDSYSPAEVGVAPPTHWPTTPALDSSLDRSVMDCASHLTHRSSPGEVFLSRPACCPPSQMQCRYRCLLSHPVGRVSWVGSDWDGMKMCAAVSCLTVSRRAATLTPFDWPGVPEHPAPARLDPRSTGETPGKESRDGERLGVWPPQYPEGHRLRHAISAPASRRQGQDGLGAVSRTHRHLLLAAI